MTKGKATLIKKDLEKKSIPSNYWPITYGVEDPNCTNTTHLKSAGFFFLKNRNGVVKEQEVQMTNHIQTKTFLRR